MQFCTGFLVLVQSIGRFPIGYNSKIALRKMRQSCEYYSHNQQDVRLS